MPKFRWWWHPTVKSASIRSNRDSWRRPWPPSSFWSPSQFRFRTAPPRLAGPSSKLYYDLIINLLLTIGKITPLSPPSSLSQSPLVIFSSFRIHFWWTLWPIRSLLPGKRFRVLDPELCECILVIFQREFELYGLYALNLSIISAVGQVVLELIFFIRSNPLYLLVDFLTAQEKLDQKVSFLPIFPFKQASKLWSDILLIKYFGRGDRRVPNVGKEMNLFQEDIQS